MPSMSDLFFKASFGSSAASPAWAGHLNDEKRKKRKNISRALVVAQRDGTIWNVYSAKIPDEVGVPNNVLKLAININAHDSIAFDSPKKR